MRGKCYRFFVPAAVALGAVLAATASSGAGYQGALSGTQALSLRDTLSTVFASINGRKFISQIDKDASLSEGIAHVAVQTIRSSGTSTAGSVTSEIIAVAASYRIPETDVGRGLAKAAVEISPCGGASNQADCDSAKQVAQSVANEGTVQMADSFATTVTSIGGSLDLAAISLGTPQFTSAIPGSVSGNPTYGSVVPPPPPPACGNPSCT